MTGSKDRVKNLSASRVEYLLLSTHMWRQVPLIPVIHRTGVIDLPYVRGIDGRHSLDSIYPFRLDNQSMAAWCLEGTAYYCDIRQSMLTLGSSLQLKRAFRL